MNKIYNRRFWLMSLFILPTISPAVYMIRRNSLLKYPVEEIIDSKNSK
jgi:hypothetical protein